MTKKLNAPRVLAVDPFGGGFGFAVLEGPERLVDWGLRGTKDKDGLRALARLEELLDHYGPDAIVVEDLTDPSVRRGHRAALFIRSVMKTASDYGIPLRTVSSKGIRKAFPDARYLNKHRLATRICETFPELGPRVPPERKVWMAEDARTALFDAVSFALGYFASRPGPRPNTDQGDTLRDAA